MESGSTVLRRAGVETPDASVQHACEMMADGIEEIAKVSVLVRDRVKEEYASPNEITQLLRLGDE